MKIKYFVSLFMLFTSTTISYSQLREAETFLDGFEGTGVYIDTTGISNYLEITRIFRGRVYGSKGFIMQTNEDIFEMQLTKMDSFGINAIKSKFTDKREIFEQLEQKLGKYFFDKKSDLLANISKNERKNYERTR